MLVREHGFSVNEQVFVMFISDVVAVVIALDVMNQRLEVEVWQLVHDLEHNVFKELVVELGRARQHVQIGAMLRKAAVKDSIVFIVSVHYGCLQPLVIAVADEALATLKVLRAIHLAMRSIVWTKCLILTNGMLHHGTAIVHL